MNRKKDFLKDIIVIIIVLAFVMPVAAFANDEMIDVTFNIENTSDMENVVEIFTNSNEVTTSDTIARDPFGQYMYYDDGEDSGWYYESGMTDWDTEMISVVDTDTYIDSGNTEVLPTTGVTIYVDDDRPSEWYNDTGEDNYRRSNQCNCRWYGLRL